LRTIRWQSPKALVAWHQLACTLQAAAVHVVFFFSVSFLHQAIGGADPRTLAVLRDCGDTKKAGVGVWSLFVI